MGKKIILKIVAIMQTGINHHGKRQAAMKIASKLNTINTTINIVTSLYNLLDSIVEGEDSLFDEIGL